MVRLLYAQDDQYLIQTLNYQIKKWFPGLEVTLARDGEEAISLIKSTPSQIFILDDCMPIKNGIEVFKYIQEFGQDYRVIFLTARDDKKDQKMWGRLKNWKVRVFYLPFKNWGLRAWLTFYIWSWRLTHFFYKIAKRQT